MALAELILEPNDLWLDHGSYIAPSRFIERGEVFFGPIGEWFEEQGLFYQILTNELVEEPSPLNYRRVPRKKLIAYEETILLFKMTWL